MFSPSETELDFFAPQKHWSRHDIIPGGKTQEHEDDPSDILLLLLMNEHKQIASGLSTQQPQISLFRGLRLYEFQTHRER